MTYDSARFVIRSQWPGCYAIKSSIASLLHFISVCIVHVRPGRSFRIMIALLSVCIYTLYYLALLLIRITYLDIQ